MVFLKGLSAYWLRFSCFLIGWDHLIIKDCSELSKRDTKRYSSAILLICIVWFFVGFAFASRYLSLNLGSSFFGGLIAIVCVIQIERQIILSSKSNWLAGFRIFLAIIMSLIGAIMIDQYIFHNDVEGKIESSRRQHVEDDVKIRYNELNARIDNLNNELKRLGLEMKSQQEKFTNELYGKGKSSKLIGYGSIAKGQQVFLDASISQTEKLNKEKYKLEDEKLKIREKIERKVFNSPRGFIEEFNILIELILSSGWSMFIYFIFVFFFLLIELIIVATKYANKTKNDYENIVDFQLGVRLNQLQIIEVENSKKIGRESLIINSNNLASKVL